MKKKLIFMAMLTVLIALCFTGCDLFAKAKSIVITDIPSTYNTKFGVVGLVDKNNKAVAVSLPVTIAGGQFEGELLDENGNEFTDKGTYYVVLLVYSDASGKSDKVIHSAVKANQKIEDEVTTISYNKFTPESLSSIKSLFLK